MELWYTEKQTPNVGITCKTAKTLYTTKSEYQDIAVIDTLQFGRMLVIDGTVQTTIEDEYIYHEMISHVPLNTKTNAKKVLIVGGGDGGVVREVLKHKSVEKAYLVEIDQKVVETGKKYLPEISCELENPRCEIHICDGIKFIHEHKNEFDVVIIDSTDPVGPAVGLFKLDFYKSIYESLKDDGLFVAQTESPFYCKKLIHDVYSDISKVFPITKLYLAAIPTYPSGLWTFTMGSKKYDPEKITENDIEYMKTRYYNYSVHMASFKLPNFVKDIIK